MGQKVDLRVKPNEIFVGIVAIDLPGVQTKELLIFHGSSLNFYNSLQNYENCKGLAQHQNFLSVATN